MEAFKIDCILQKLYRAETLNANESQFLFTHIIQGHLDASQLAATLISMKIRGETGDEIVGAVNACLSHAKPFPRPDYPFADIVGTGGDGSNSINISTISALVAACCGVKVAKHGNRKISSQAGSSDLLQQMGVNLNTSPDTSRQLLDQLDICFLYAPHYHRGFQHAISVRKQLKTPTVFNLLGPLINPARPPLALIGVYHIDLLPLMAKAVQQLNYQRAMIVYGGGLDEVSLHSTTQIVEINEGEMINYSLTAADFDLPSYPLSSLRGGTAEENHILLTRLLRGKGEKAHVATVAANVAMLLKLFGHENLRSNVQQAMEIIQSGQAYERITAYIAAEKSV